MSRPLSFVAVSLTVHLPLGNRNSRKEKLNNGKRHRKTDRAVVQMNTPFSPGTHIVIDYNTESSFLTVRFLHGFHDRRGDALGQNDSRETYAGALET